MYSNPFCELLYKSEAKMTNEYDSKLQTEALELLYSELLELDKFVTDLDACIEDCLEDKALVTIQGYGDNDNYEYRNFKDSLSKCIVQFCKMRKKFNEKYFLRLIRDVFKSGIELQGVKVIENGIWCDFSP